MKTSLSAIVSVFSRICKIPIDFFSNAVYSLGTYSPRVTINPSPTSKPKVQKQDIYEDSEYSGGDMSVLNMAMRDPFYSAKLKASSIINAADMVDKVLGDEFDEFIDGWGDDAGD